MKISVRTLDGRSIPVEVGPDDTVEAVKRQVQKKERIRGDLQRLFFNNKQLEDGQPLSTYGIIEDSNLHIVPGAPEKTNTVAGGFGLGNADNELCFPYGLAVDDNGTVIIADWGNHRIVQWEKNNYTNGNIVVGSHEQGHGLHQLSGPTDVLIDKETNSLIICDRGNRRIVRWSRQAGTTEGETIIDNIACWGVALDNERSIYVSDIEKHQVLRYRNGERDGTVVAGHGGRGTALDQLNQPTYVFVDERKNIYVSDTWNHRVMKYPNQSTEGSVVARGFPRGILVDKDETLYVADYGNHRLMRWPKDSKEGTVIAGAGAELGGNQLYFPWGVCSDQEGRLCVTDHLNHRVQCFPLN